MEIREVFGKYMEDGYLKPENYGYACLSLTGEMPTKIPDSSLRFAEFE